MRRTTTVLSLAVAGLLLSAGPAAADPAGPTNYRSVVTAVETPDGEVVDLEAEVLGGDAFLLVAAPSGTEIEVPGYDDEPYVRIGADGLVEVNQRAPTHWFNEDRYGADVPPMADAEASPVWRAVADDGRYAWHDHRIHWMSPGPPDQVDTAAREPQQVFDWEIPLRVDDEPVVIRGELAWHPGPAAWVPVAWLVAGLAAASLLVDRLRVPAAVLAAVVSLPAGAASLAVATGQPPGSDSDPSLLVLPALSLAAALLALGARRRERWDARARLLGAAATVPLLIWGVLHVGVLTRPIAPEPLSATGLRPVVAAALTLGAVALLDVVRHALGSLGDPLDDEEAAEEGAATTGGEGTATSPSDGPGGEPGAGRDR